ncbi:site-specific recombinase, phage integrase family [mine drainage metagenome]|uniref:Site-specific recombinase, phage integrase family n=1 Tax=mine drainage metagenome TaxID=410659 RepID=T1BF53_9ZZZZ
MVWQVRIVRQGYPPQYRTFDTKGQAEVWARRVEGEMDSGSFLDRSEGDRTTVAEALNRYAHEITPRKATATARREGHTCANVQRGLGRIALSRLTGKDVADYIREREIDGAAPATIVKELNLLSHLYTVARSSWGMSYLVNPVPLAKTARPKLPKGRERRLESGEEERLLEAAQPQFGAVIRFALATAMRRGEIVSLRWDQVDLKRRAVLLAETKNGETRTVPLSPVALEVLRTIPRQIDGSVFGMSANAIKLAWPRLMCKTAIKGLRFHDLRHEAISRLFEDTDLDIMEIRAISGHKTLQMLARYTHLRTHRLADRLAGMGRKESWDGKSRNQLGEDGA